jgi:glutaredoxin 3
MMLRSTCQLISYPRTALARHVGNRGRHVPTARNTSTLPRASLVDDIVAKNKSTPCVVYSKTYCPYCSDVKDLFQKQLKVDAKIVELDTLADGDDMQAALVEISGMRTVPQVFVGGELVGGCDDTLAAYRSGTLEKLLKSAGVHLS